MARKADLTETGSESVMIHILPGMGADHTMFSGPAWHGIAGASFLDWPAYHGETTIAAIADRVIAEAAIADGATLIGVSLGGIVACEIAKKRRLKALVLIGSAIHAQEVSRLLATLRPLAQYAPIEFVQRAVGKVPDDVVAMFARGDPGFIRAACRAIFDWDGCDAARITPVRIHGTRDHMIPMPANVDLALDGGHLVAMTHADQCVAFLRQQRLV